MHLEARVGFSLVVDSSIAIPIVLISFYLFQLCMSGLVVMLYVLGPYGPKFKPYVGPFLCLPFWVRFPSGCHALRQIMARVFGECVCSCPSASFGGVLVELSAAPG